MATTALDAQPLSRQALLAAVETLRAGRGWAAAVVASGARDRWALRRFLREAGLLEAFPRNVDLPGRPRKAELTEKEFKFAIDARGQNPPVEWLVIVRAINADRPLKEHISRRTLASRLQDAARGPS